MFSLIALLCLISPFSAYYFLTVYKPRKRGYAEYNNVQEARTRRIEMPVNLPPPARQTNLKVFPSNLGYPSREQLVVQMDLSSTYVSPNVPEFQAVILAGYGNSLSPLTNDHKDTANPKALLPIGNKPMITFPLAWLEDAGVTNVLLICPASHRSAILHHTHSDISSASFSTLRIDIQTFDDDDPPVGTCAVLRRFASRIQSDFIVLPCDFIPPPKLLLSTVLNRYRVNLDQLVISTLFFETPNEEKRSEDSQAPPLIAYDESSKTLLHVDYSTSEADELNLHMRLLWKYPKLRVVTRFADSHVYVCRRSILTLLALKPSLESFREDLLPFLCKTQYRKHKRFCWEPVLNESSNIPNHPYPLSSRTTSRASSAPVSPIARHTVISRSDIRCGIEIHTLDDGLTGRANILRSYEQLNLALLKVSSLQPQAIQNGASQTIDVKAQLSPECIIAPSARISERTNIKHSIIGLHCVIGKQVRISDSIILDHVVIEDGAKVEGCTLGRSTHIGAKAQLTKSVTQPGYEVEAGATIKGEKLETVEWDPRVED